MWNYKTSLRWIDGVAGEAGSENKPSIAVNSPPEFGGQPDKWSPEDLLVSSVESCLMMTALDIAKRQKIALRSYRSTATGHLEKTKDGLRFTGIEVDIVTTCETPADQEKIVGAVHMAEKYCPVSNAVKCPITIRVAADN